MGDYFVKIYGAPYTFDLYKGTEQEQNYFHTFDNGCTDSVKMSIHRMRNGWVAYNYLRYGFITSGGREGSFFGISIVFNKMYCSDFTSMYDLFEGIYQALAKETVLFDTPDQGKPRYKIRSFAEAENVIQWIEATVKDNLQKGLANDLKAAQFPQVSSSGMEARLNPKVGNVTIAEYLKKYEMVTISPLYGTVGGDTIVKIVPPEVIVELFQNKNESVKESKKLSDDVESFQNDFKALNDTGGDVTRLGGRYQSLIVDLNRALGKAGDNMAKINKWLNIRPENASALVLDREELTRAQKKIQDLTNTLSIYKPKVTGHGPGPVPGPSPVPVPGPGPVPVPEPEPEPEPSLWDRIALFIRKNKNKLIAACVVLALIIGFLVWIIPSDGGDTGGQPDKPRVEVYGDSLMNLARAEFSQKKWVDAYKYCKEITTYNDTAKVKYSHLQNVQDTLNQCQNYYLTDCIDNIPSTINKAQDAINWVSQQMRAVDYTLSESDKTTIKNKYNNAPTPKPAPEQKIIDVSILLVGESVIDKSNVKVKKNFTLTCKPTQKNTAQIHSVSWNITDANGTIIKSGSGKSFTTEGGLKAGTYTVTCFVNGSKSPNATASITSKAFF